MTRRVDVARAALLEVGRPDLAEQVKENRAGNPSFNPPCAGGGPPLLPCDQPLVLRAFWLGHLADPEGTPWLLAPWPPLDRGACNA